MLGENLASTFGNLEISARIANPPEGLLAKYTRKEKDFFYNYAQFVLRSVTSPQVKEQLIRLVERERFIVNKSIDLRIMVFPARPLVGRPRNVLHGSYNHDSAQISLYPLKLPREWLRSEGLSLFKTIPGELSRSQSRVLSQIFESAVSTLIHEVLHVKFEGRNLPRYQEEAIVRKLENKYAQELLESLKPSPA
jgi:hypothetical protein